MEVFRLIFLNRFKRYIIKIVTAKRMTGTNMFITRWSALFNFVFTFMGLKFLNSYASPQGSEKDSKIFFLPLILLCVLTLTVGLIICLFINHYTANLAFNFHLVINIFVPVILFAVTILMISYKHAFPFSVTFVSHGNDISVSEISYLMPASMSENKFPFMVEML